MGFSYGLQLQFTKSRLKIWGSGKVNLAKLLDCQVMNIFDVIVKLDPRTRSKDT